MNITEKQELETHRAYLRAGATLSNIRQRLELLEKPRPTAQQCQQAEQQAKVEEFWQLAQAEQDTHPDMTASACRQRVLKQHPELSTVYPRIQN